MRQTGTEPQPAGRPPIARANTVLFRPALGWCLWAASLGNLLVCAPAIAQARYAPREAAAVRVAVLAWAQQHKATPESLTLVQTLWEKQASASISPAECLELAVKSLGMVDPALAGFEQSCQDLSTANVEALVALANRPTADSFEKNTLNSYLGRCLAEQRLYDEALTQLLLAEPEQAIDPAAVLFYRAVAAQEILQIPTALTALSQLLDQTDQVPPRYSSVAELMRAELEGLESQSLGEIARLMNDSERRLDLGRAGENVQGVQDRIVSNLDELIKKLEAQQGGGGGGGGSGANNSNESSSGADDSRVKGSTAPGETDPKKFNKQGNWGDLPPKEQAAAKNLINREFPSHYRQAIEVYFKKLAGRPAPADK